MNGKYFKNTYLISIIFVYYAISGKTVFLKQQKVHKALQISAMAPHQTYFDLYCFLPTNDHKYPHPPHIKVEKIQQW